MKTSDREGHVLRGALVAGVLALGVCAPAAAVEFYFNAYGGFTDPRTPLDPPTPGAGFPLPEYVVPATYDGDISSFQHFGWGTAQQVEHSHLTVNERVPVNDSEDPNNFFDHITAGVTPTPGPGPIAPITVGDADGEIIGWLDHHNFPIAEIFGPENVAFHYHVDIYGSQADADAQTNALFQSGALDFTVEIWETRNAPPCPPDGGPTGPDGSVCDDRFRIALGWEAGESELGQIFDEMIGAFVFDGQSYEVNMSGLWDDDVLEEVFWSPEDGISRMFLRADIQQIPAPATLALFGLGLLLLVRPGGKHRR